jgi:hypothetical protein
LFAIACLLVSVVYGCMAVDRGFIVTVTAVLKRGGGSPSDFEARVTDALMNVKEVATARIEYAPLESVCRLDAIGPTRTAVQAACRVTVERVVRSLGGVCSMWSVVALTLPEWRREARTPPA